MAIILFIISLGIWVGVGAAIAAALCFIWNHVAVTAFHAPELTFWQTWGCMILIGFVAQAFKRATSK